MNFFNSVIAATTISASILFNPAHAKSYAWGCMGHRSMGSDLRINGTGEPGADIVKVRNSNNKIVIQFNAMGPKTEEVIFDVGMNGEDGIIQKRVYVDNNGKKWIYKNWDAHPSFQSTENSDLYISCFP